MTYSMFLENGDKEMLKWSHFFPIYEQHLSSFVNRPVRVLEIGVLGGGSLQYWKKWFGPSARIVGVDIDERCAEYVEPQISVEIGSQNDVEFLRGVAERHGPFDVVIDDGSHTPSDVITTFECLYPLLAERGVYLVEDIEHSYYPEQGGGVGAEGSFVEYAKRICDYINGQAWRVGRDALEGKELFTENTMSVSFYSSMIVFQRGFYGTPTRYWQRTGGPGHAYFDNIVPDEASH